jgi:hypothetical protein
METIPGFHPAGGLQPSKSDPVRFVDPYTAHQSSNPDTVRLKRTLIVNFYQ